LAQAILAQAPALESTFKGPPSSSTSSSMASALVGKTAPDFEMTLEDGSTRKLSDVIAEGKPIILDFYANF